MPEFENLRTISELNITLAGLSGVVVAFIYRGTLAPIDRARFIMLFFTSINGVALSLIPVCLHSLGLGGPDVWRWASSTFLATSIFLRLSALGV